MQKVDEEIQRLEREIQEDEETLVAARVREVREREEELAWFEELSDAERTEVFRSSPGTYRTAMRALQRRAERRLVGGDA